MSALQFERLGDPVIAYKTLDEMLSNPRIAELPIAAAAETKRSALFDALPEGASKKPPPRPPRTTWRSANENSSAQIFHSLILKPRLLLTTLLLAATQVSAQLSPTLSEIRSTLQEPVTIALDGGNQQTGQVTRWDESELRIEVSLGGGTAELTFPAKKYAASLSWRRI